MDKRKIIGLIFGIIIAVVAISGCIGSGNEVSEDEAI